MIPDHVALPLEVVVSQLQRDRDHRRACLDNRHHFIWNSPARAGESCLRCAWCGLLGEGAKWKKDDVS